MIIAIDKSSKKDKYHWTNHSLMKMKYYGLSQQRIKRVIKSPERIEEGIVEKTIASMQTAGSSKHPYEIWVMYQIGNSKSEFRNPKQIRNSPPKADSPMAKKFENKETLFSNKLIKTQAKKLKIISAWRYPGKSPKQNPIPQEILDEIRKFL